ncbi:hypothetical protein E4U55_008284 [Claviceps digitariae]|nr:hypothetical protein E4U55_008284 [Claviceps digitariae]
MAFNATYSATASRYAISPQKHMSWRLAISLAILYPILCFLFRFRRVRAMRRALGFTDRQSLATMTSVQAQMIVKELNEWEFPLLYRKSLQVALAKFDSPELQTYGIPSISSLLASTSLFSDPSTSSKRYEDTAVLIGEFIAHGPDEQRTHQALGRINSIHGPYIKAGKISNQDLLYTLSLFVIEPIAWINRWEWRQLTDMEVCAQGAFWKYVGDAMDIKYTGLLKRDSWRDGIEFVEDIAAWAQQYEMECMVPAATNKQLADELVGMLLHYVPRRARSLANHVIGVMMGERLRHAMMHPTPPPGVEKFVNYALLFRGFLIRHFVLPRFSPKVEFSDRDARTGRYYHYEYLLHPYYVPPTFGNRWGPQAWLTWALGGTVPGGRDGSKYNPWGYHFEEVGPVKNTPFDGEKLKEWEGQVERKIPLGCPFAFGC